MVFVGRENELGSLIKRFESIVRNPDNARVGISLITGIPGVGKSALLNRFITQAKECKPKPHIVRLDAGKISSFDDPVDYFYRVISQQTGIPFSTQGSVTTGTAVSGGVSSPIGSAKASRASHSTKSYIGPFKIDAPMIVKIDEIQNIDNDSVDQRRRIGGLLGELHEGDHGLPIMLVGAGLPNAERVLGNSGIGISRITPTFVLGNLADHECALCTVGTIEAYGYNETPVEWVDEIVKRSQNFPHHLSVYLKSFVDNVEVGETYSDKLLAKVIREGDEFRESYYSKRVASTGEDAKYIDSPFIRELLTKGDGIPQIDLELAIRKQAEIYQRDGVDPQSVINKAIQKGVFEQRWDGDPIYVPIPSFKDYLLSQGDDDAPGDSTRCRHD